MENNKIISEATQSVDIAQTDQNLTVDAMFQQSSLPSLAKQIFSVAPISGPSGALFNLRKKPGTNDFELVRANVSVESPTPVKTTVTREAIQDMFAMYGKEAEQVIGKMFRGIANEQENTSALTFLNANAVAATNLTLTDSLNAETNLFEITQKVHELVLKINSKNLRSYESWAVIPYSPLAGIMALTKYVGGEDKETRGLFIGQVGQTKFYVNPDATSSVAYVGIKDSDNMSKSSAVFSPYQAQIVETQDPDSGEMVYFIFNRYAITMSPLNEVGNELMYKFSIL